MHISERQMPNLFPNLFPNLPSLIGEVGKCCSLCNKGFPNLPNIPNVFRVHTYTHTRAPLCMHETSKIGWEGWEGWEEQAVMRLSGSQPSFEGWEGWEQGWERRGRA